MIKVELSSEYQTILFAAAFGFIAGMVFYAFLGPENQQECVLKHISKAQTNAAVHVINATCSKLHPEQRAHNISDNK